MDEDFKALITREDIQAAIAALEQGEAHAFGPSTFYDILEGGRRYPPKAVVGLAVRRVLGRALRPDEFSGGEESWAFRLLRDRGFNVVKKPSSSDTSELLEQPEPFDPVSRTWRRCATVEERIRRKLQLGTPSDQVRRAALEVLGWAIEAADADRSDAWYLRETEHGLRLLAGRLFACELRRSTLRISVIGPVGDDVLGTLGAEIVDEFKWIPGGQIVGMPQDKAATAFSLLKDAMDAFIDSAMSRVRRAVDLGDHTPEAINYVSTVLERDLPQPEPDSEISLPDGDDDPEEEDVGASREPKVRGRAPIFENGQRSIASLISEIEREVIALPDLQRPFVWEDTKVRDLLDSLFVGFPVGTLVFWHTSDEKDARALGAKGPGLRATTLVIDGQQRLTSLYAVMKGERVVGKDGEMRQISIAFRPRDGRFEVADAAIRRDPEFLADVTDIWNGTRPKPQIRRDLMNALRERGRLVDERYEDAVERNLDRAGSIADYRFPTVDIRRTTATDEATEEDVAEIFVRINNQGVRLGQADFVLTLLSVYHGELRDKLEARAREMSIGAVVGLDTQQLLRAVCGVAFGRARMSAVYRFLRGVDPDTGEAKPERRVTRLNELDNAANDCIELTPWRDYLLRVKHAGFVSQSLVASKNAIVNAYAFYIRGRKAAVPKPKLDGVISRWVFASLLTARYSGSSETAFEEDLGRLTRVDGRDPDNFVRELDAAMVETLTGDYWTQTLVSALETQRGRDRQDPYDRKHNLPLPGDWTSRPRHVQERGRACCSSRPYPRRHSRSGDQPPDIRARGPQATGSDRQSSGLEGCFSGSATNRARHRRQRTTDHPAAAPHRLNRCGDARLGRTASAPHSTGRPGGWDYAHRARRADRARSRPLRLVFRPASPQRSASPQGWRPGHRGSAQRP
jgi:Protein of unknown function DUF262